MVKAHALSFLLAQGAILASAVPHPAPAPHASLARPACLKRSFGPFLSSSLHSSSADPIVESSPVAPFIARADAKAPAQYTPNPSIGGGRGPTDFVESAHFRVYGAPAAQGRKTLQHLEAAHSCFVETLGWRTPGLSFNTGGVGKDVGPWYKLNLYSKTASAMPGAAGVQGTDMDAGLAYLDVVDEYLEVADVVVHEFGHAMHLSEKNWIHQGNTGAWWEPIANFIADTYISTPTCNAARKAAGLPGTEGNSIVDLPKVIGDSHQVIVDGTPDTANYYQSWPFLAYLTNNPDALPGLGKTTLLRMIREYKIDSNETPLHSLARILAASGRTTIPQVVGRYWARMAYVDIGHPKVQAAFVAQRPQIRYNNLAAPRNGVYTVKPDRAPRYMGANIIPLITTGATVAVEITSTDKAYTATLVVRSGGKTVKYTDVVGGKGSVKVAAGDEVSLVVVKTPALVMYDAFKISAELNKGLAYSVKITGATARV